MAKAYTTSTASIKVPVVLSFTCPKCGQHGTVNKTALLSAQATVRGYNSSGAGTIAQTNPDSPEQLLAAAPDAVVWKQNRQWELCHAHDLVPLESALQGRPVFLGSQRPTDATTRSLRQFEEKK